MNHESRSIPDVAIVGAGAAGLMSAICCARAGLRVLLLDGREKIGAKILMSGGTRCNVTNQKVTEQDYESEHPRAVRNVLSAFSSERAVDFFKELGVELVLEPGGKYFPKTHSAQTVLDALLGEVKRLSVRLETGRKVKQVQSDSGTFVLSGPGFTCAARTVVVCAGGLSYPKTGSDGGGYEIARFFGHRLVETSPALTPLLTNDADWKALSGVALPVKLTLLVNGKREAEFEDSFLFTHFGFSGPAALNMSRHWDRARKDGSVKLLINFLPQIAEEKLRSWFKSVAQTSPSKLLKNLLAELLPKRLAEVILKKSNIPESAALNQFKQEWRERLVKRLRASELSVTRVFGYEKAEATAGGVSLDEVDTKTMESKLRPGLFFAGEVLDVDGRIGGFNFQWAWSSGTVAARGVIQKIKGK